MFYRLIDILIKKICVFYVTHISEVMQVGASSISHAAFRFDTCEVSLYKLYFCIYVLAIFIFLIRGNNFLPASFDVVLIIIVLLFASHTDDFNNCS